jgi:protein ImuB
MTAKRFLTIWFKHLHADWLCRRKPSLKTVPFVIAAPQHGRMVITAVNHLADAQEIEVGTVVADARAIYPGLEVVEVFMGLAEGALEHLGKWMIRFTPTVAIDGDDGLILDISGCAHLWGGEEPYLKEIHRRLLGFGYTVKAGIADTIGAAWAITHFGKGYPIVERNGHQKAIMTLPPEALRLEEKTVTRLHKLGLHQAGLFMHMPPSSLQRRFGKQLLIRLHQALGTIEEIIEPIKMSEPYHERLPCLEPIVNAVGIEIALQRLLDALCIRLTAGEKGLRSAILKAFRVDGKIEEISIATSRPSNSPGHLTKLFNLKVSTIEPALGIELFVLEAGGVEDVTPFQIKMWEAPLGLTSQRVAELIDTFSSELGVTAINRYLPAEFYWPERAFRKASSLEDEPAFEWNMAIPRPLYFLVPPEKIKVTAPIPDYPPMNFRYKGKLYEVKHADGPERIKQEWWIQQGLHRDYFYVEATATSTLSNDQLTEAGFRCWIFRAGHYSAERSPEWFLHGLYA